MAELGYKVSCFVLRLAAARARLRPKAASAPAKDYQNDGDSVRRLF